MEAVLTAVGLILALAGALCALFPDLVKRTARQALETPGDTLRLVGIISAALGVALVWFVRG
jgi:uncharacterized protein